MENGSQNTINQPQKTTIKKTKHQKTMTATELSQKLGHNWESYWNDKYKHFIKYKANALSNNNTLLRDTLMVDGLMGLLVTHKNFKPDKGAAFSTLLWTNSYYSMLRHIKQYNQPRIPAGDFKHYHEAEPIDQKNQALYQHLHLIINNLNPEYQKIIQLKYYENASLQQIADQCQITIGQTRYKLQKALKQLQGDCSKYLPSLK